MDESQLGQQMQPDLKIATKKIVPFSEIVTTLEQCEKIFPIPQQAKERVLKTVVSVVPEDEIIAEVRKITGEKEPLNGVVEDTENEKMEKAAVYEALGTSSQQIKEKTSYLLEQRLNHIKNLGGIHIKDAEGQSRILIKENSYVDRKTILAHEGLHAAADGFQSEEGAYHYLNEASTEILRIAGEYQDSSARNLLKRIDEGSISVYYKSHVRRLLAIMTTTDIDPEPVDVKRLAHYYFQDNPTNAIMFLMEVSRKGSPQTQKNVKSIIEEFY